MILALPFSHTDLEQAYRLLKWIGWLSFQDCDSMKKEKILLVPSRHAAQRSIHRKICALAVRIFGEARTFTPEGEHETGWPGACNFMLKAALEHVEKHFQDDLFLLEPDAIPICPTWWQEIKEEWKDVPVHFMGASVPYNIPHMTGIGVYGRNWRSVAPKLAEVQNALGWDTFASDQIVPHAHFTQLIQHVWWNFPQRSGKYDNLSLQTLNPVAVIFHQDKEGRLFRMLDEAHWQGEADEAVHYSERIPEEQVMTHYFLTNNLNKVIKAHGKVFMFDALDQIGGVWRGTYKTESEAEVIALQSLAGGSVKEIEASDYEQKIKKKQPNFSLSPRGPVANPQGAQEARINQSPAVLVDAPTPKAPQPDSIEGAPVVEDIEKVLRIGKVKPPETAPKKNAPARRAIKKGK